MQHSLKLRNCRITKLRNSQRGYIMITLMLALALITLALLAVLPDIAQQIKRDREDELRHRGTAYMRAIQHFYKKFGRYPTKIEDLENTSNVRFLRKRYTDPVNFDKNTGKEMDFKFLHQQDISLNNGPVLGQTAGQGGIGGSQGGLGGPGGFGGSQGGFGGSQGGFGGASGGLGGSSGFSLGPQPGAGPGGANAGGSSSFGGSSSGTSSSSSSSDNSSSGNSSSGNSGDQQGSSSSGGSSSSSSSSSSSISSSNLGGQVFGGGPILGVASTSKAKAIHIYYTKDHYNDWLFVYMPTGDRGGLLQGPINPGVQTGTMGGIAGAQPVGGQGQGGFGQSGFGQGGLGQGGFGQGLGGGLSSGTGQGLGSQTQTPSSPAPNQQQ